MGPKTRQRLDELYEEYRQARADGELARAVRLLTRIHEIESAADESTPTTPEDERT